MQHVVPRFEHEAKIVGPFTFKQFIFLIVAAISCLILYFVFGKKISFPFILSSAIIGGSALSLAFLKPGGRPLPVILTHFLTFSVSPKIYIWKKKEMAPPKLVSKRELKKLEPIKKATSVPKIAGKSRLKNLAAGIETRTK